MMKCMRLPVRLGLAPRRVASGLSVLQHRSKQSPAATLGCTSRRTHVLKASPGSSSASIAVPIANLQLTHGQSGDGEPSTAAPAVQGQLAGIQDAVQQLTEEEAAERKARLWKAAIKLPMYSVGYIPVLVGAACVFYVLGDLPLRHMLGYLAASVMIIAWLNLSNDAFDAQTGVDVSKPESVVNLTGSAALVGSAAALFFAAGAGLLAWLLTGAGDMRAAALLAFSIACGYVYQGPPFRLSYQGLGEPLCFMAFGPSATPAFFLAMAASVTAAPHGVIPAAAATNAAAATAVAVTGASAKASSAASFTNALAGLASAVLEGARLLTASVPPLVWLVSVIVGLNTALILLTSHFHQVEGDRAAGKLSPVVRLGVAGGLKVLQAGVATSYGLVVAGVLAGLLPAPAAMAVMLMSLSAAREMLSYAADNYKAPSRIAVLKRYACAWHIAFGCALAGGLAVSRLTAGWWL